MNGDGSLRSKISARLLLEHAGRERPVGLAVLDPLVEDVLHVGAPRIGDDRSVAERARTELHPALEPADHLAGGDRLRHLAVEVAVVQPAHVDAGVPAVAARALSMARVDSRVVVTRARCRRRA